MAIVVTGREVVGAFGGVLLSSWSRRWGKRLTRVSIESGSIFAVFLVRWLFHGWRRIYGGYQSATTTEVSVAQWIWNSIPDRGGVFLSAFTSECDADGLLELSVAFMIQYDAMQIRLRAMMSMSRLMDMVWGCGQREARGKMHHGPSSTDAGGQRTFGFKRGPLVGIAVHGRI